MTIREVAKLAGVSLQTVSNVLNGRTTQVGPQTRQRVLEAIETLGYQPNAHARGLRSQRTYTVGFLTVDPSARFLADPFHTLILSGMADTLREHDYCLLVQALHPGRPGEAFASLYRQRRFDGAVVHLSGFERERQRCVAQLQKSGCPFVLIEERVAGPTAACVLADNRQGARRAVDFLRARGHERIGFLTTERSWPAVEERMAGYRAALKAYHLPARIGRVETESSDAARDWMLAQLDAQPAPSAVICSNDVLAVGVLQAVKKVGRRVPNQLAIVGFDDFDFARHVEPPLTTVALPGYEMGRQAADLLLDYLRDQHFPTQEVTFPTALVERGTA
jgi:DNA-binding LacI/PurR family transcriptional regulator